MWTQGNERKNIPGRWRFLKSDCPLLKKFLSAESSLASSTSKGGLKRRQKVHIPCVGATKFCSRPEPLSNRNAGAALTCSSGFVWRSNQGRRAWHHERARVASENGRFCRLHTISQGVTVSRQVNWKVPRFCDECFRHHKEAKSLKTDCGSRSEGETNRLGYTGRKSWCIHNTV